jgi:Tfp pilus assembly protein PilX
MSNHGMRSAGRHAKLVLTNRRQAAGVYGSKRRSRGFTLIASLLMLLLLSGIAIGLLMIANTESKVGGTDMQNNVAYHAAEGGIEKMYSDLSAVFQNSQAPTTSQICAVSNTPPSMIGVTWKTYSVAPASGCGTTAPSTPTANWNTLSGGPDAGLYAQIIPVNMQATAAMSGGQEVNMTRTAQVALIPVFQFGVFSDSDLSFFSGPNFDMVGPVHTNGDLYPFVGPGSTLTFHNKLEAYGNVVRTQLANGWLAATNYNGTVNIPTTNNGCSTPTAPATALVSCQTMDGPTAASYGDGSVTGAGSSTAQSGSNYNGLPTSGTWNTFSNSTTTNMIINANYWTQSATTPPGTGAQNLTMPFVNGTTLAYQLIRRPPPGEDPTSALAQSQEYNLAEIHVLLSDDPADLPGGASDANNVRLANITTTEATATGATATNPYGITMTAGNYASTFTAPGSGTYNLYFAAASNAVPSAGTVTANSTANLNGVDSPDWPYAPNPWFGNAHNANPTLQGLQPTGPAGGPGAPTVLGGPTSVAPALVLCPPASPGTSTSGTAFSAIADGYPTGCTNAPVSPYYTVGGTAAVNNSTSVAVQTASWNLIDGYLRVEYKNNSGNWVAVTNEWLQLGFARSTTPPTLPGGSAPAAGTNPINPNAILLLQQPADRGTISSGLPTYAQLTTGIAPSCTATNSVTVGHTTTTYCTTWAATPPLLLDTGATYWQFGLTPGTPTTQSVTRFNWYPLNFYDAREGEVRDTAWGDNSCTTNGVMNAVEIDVGNLKRWLAGSIGSSGSSVNYTAQNGYVLYFSDRRGMLINPNAPAPNTANTKSGDSGLEDVINSSVTAGTPDGGLDPIPAGRTFSPEDVNENGVLDNFGAANLGLGFWGIQSDTTTLTNLNAKINSTATPDPFGTAAGARISSCSTTGRKNWVSGARHVLRLVDGSLGNVPVTPAGTITDPGGFTVASENPVYIWGDYNSNSADTVWNSPAVDVLGHSSAAVIADAVTFLSSNWSDLPSFGLGGDGTVTNPSNRTASTDYYRVAIAGGKNINFPRPTWEPAYPNTTGDDFGTDGGVHNFLRYLENWGGTLNYKGSIVSLYYATYATGIYKCCTVVYSPPTRNYSFDLDFSTPQGLPPGTPMFKDVESLSYRELFSARTD